MKISPFLPYLRIYWQLGLLFSCLCISLTLSAQNPRLEEAQELARAGQHEAAAIILKQLSTQYPFDLPVLLAEAHNLSWGGKYQQSQKAFQQILKQYPDHPEALAGLGYAQAWNQEYKAAKNTFLQLSKQGTSQQEANKGLAYIALWTRNFQAAVRQFSNLHYRYPENAEYLQALGMSYLGLRQHKQAREKLEAAAMIEPGMKEAVALILNQITAEPAFVELHTWGGYSQVATLEKTGLRAFQIQLSPTENIQTWIRYDNSLALDNFAFLQNNVVTPAWFGGGMATWKKHWTTRFELGRRILPDQGTQFFIQGEQVYNFGQNYALKLGGFYAPRLDGKAEWMGYLGTQVPLSSQFNLEPHYFLAVNESGITTHRILLNAEYRGHMEQYRIGGGLMYGIGRPHSTPQSRKSTVGANLLCQASILNHHWFLLNLRYESGFESSIFSISGGLRIRIEH